MPTGCACGVIGPVFVKRQQLAERLPVHYAYQTPTNENRAFLAERPVRK